MTNAAAHPLFLTFALAAAVTFGMARPTCEEDEAGFETARVVLQAKSGFPESRLSLFGDSEMSTTSGEAASKPTATWQSSHLDSSKATDPDPRLLAMETSLKEAVAAARNKSSKAGGHNASKASATSALMDLVRSLRNTVIDVLKEIDQESSDAQKLVQQEVDAFDECQNEWPAADHNENLARGVQDHSTCRRKTSAMKAAMDACLGQKSALKAAMDAVCKLHEDAKKDYMIASPIQDETVENWLIRASDHYSQGYTEFEARKEACDDATKNYDDLDCSLKSNPFETHENECNMSLIRLEDEFCKTAALANEVLGTYGACHAAKVAAYEDRDLELDQEQRRKLNWRFAKHQLCLIDSIKDSGVNETAFQLCTDQSEYDTSPLTMQWPATPAEKEVAMPAAVPCNAAYQNTVYADLPADARVPPCTGCAASPTTAVVTTTTATTTQEATWSLVTISGKPPPARYYHTAIYHEVRNAMYVFGGNNDYQDDTWALMMDNSNTWVPLPVTGGPPKGRKTHTAIYASAENAMVIFGGWGSKQGTHNGEPLKDVWALDLDKFSWAPVETSGDAGNPRHEHTAVYVPKTNSMVVYGGNRGYNDANDVRELSLSSKTWTKVATTGTTPPARCGHTAIYVAATDKMYVYGGADRQGVRNDIWVLDLATSTWESLATTGTVPAARNYHTAVYSAATNSMYVFGGFVPGKQSQNDVWALDLATGTGTALSTTGGPPAVRNKHTAICVPATNTMYAFGGMGNEWNSQKNDVWALKL